MREAEQLEEQPHIAVGAAPCDGCAHVPQCAAQQLSCAAFNLFARGTSEQQWRQASQAPTHSRWAAIFEHEEVERDRQRRRARRAAMTALPGGARR